MAPAALFNDDDPSSSKKKVCVMDASGHLGSALVHRLLHRGYYVHAALHNHHGELECFEGLSAAAAAAAAGDNKRLRVFQSDPLDYHSIMDAIKGCCGLFYSFETPSHQPNYDEYTAEEEVRAAHNVLEACAQTETMEKVVFTSSATAIVWRDSSPSPSPSSSSSSSPSHHDIDERNWSDINFCKKFKLWHGLSKTVAEKTAWALAMDRGVNMVSINGGLVMGPHLSITNPYLKGAAEMYEDGVFVTVDLRFLVNAHICVFEDVSSYGRYLCFNRVINCNEDAVKLAHMLSQPTASSPQHSVEERMVYQQKISNKKLNELMAHFESSFQDE